MKKINILILACCLGSEMKAQIVNADVLEQQKRIGRKNNHITKTYEGEIVKLIYGFRELGGALSGFIFRKNDGKLTYINFPSYYGKMLKPHLIEGTEVTIKVSGDPILLDMLLHKNQEYKEMEYSMKEAMNGMAELKEIESTQGKLVTSQLNTRRALAAFNLPYEYVFDARVNFIDSWKNNNSMIILDNGDSLIITGDEKKIKDMASDNISYTRMKRDEMNPLYYKNSQVYYMSSGVEPRRLSYIYGLYRYNYGLLRKEKVMGKSLLTNNQGFVNGAELTTHNGADITLQFNTEYGQIIQDKIFSSDKPVDIYYQPSLKLNQIVGINLVEEVLELNKSLLKRTTEEFTTKETTVEGKITELFEYKSDEVLRYGGMVIDDKYYVVIPDFASVSIGKKIKVGDNVSTVGYLRKPLDGEVQLKEYTIIYAKTIKLGRREYLARDLFRKR